MEINYQSIVPDGLAKQIARSIREAILQGQLKVDDRLPSEEELAAKFKVSRPTIREALKHLAAQNLIRSQRGPAGGTFVARPTFEEVSNSNYVSTTLLASIDEFELGEIAEARAAFESACLDLAAENREEDDLAAMATEIELQRSGGLGDWEFCQSDVRFHRQIALSTKNRALILSMRSIFEALHPVANMTAVRIQDRNVIVDFHTGIRSALKARDARSARKLVHEQMAYHRSTFALAREDWLQRQAAKADSR